MKTRNVRLATGLLAGVATLRQMIREIHRDGALSRVTATVLDGLYVAHLLEVCRRGRDDPRRVPLPRGVARAVGGAAAALGASLMTAGMLRFPSEAQINAQGDHELVTGGIYRYSRHPQYVGWTLLLVGIATAARSPRALALAAAYPAGVSVWLPHEEAHLAESFGDAYRDYQQRTPRWFGPPADRTCR